MQIAASISIRVVVGLGANLGDRLGQLRQARNRLAEEVTLLASSEVYETRPAGGPPQPDYLNAAVLIETTTPLPAFLDRCLAIERAMGRVRPDPVRNGPRPIDLDLLWACEAPSSAEALLGLERTLEGLTLPHPRLAQRVFALRPLLDVAPEARSPHGEPYAELPASKEPIRLVGSL